VNLAGACICCTRVREGTPALVHRTPYCIWYGRRGAHEPGHHPPRTEYLGDLLGVGSAEQQESCAGREVARGPGGGMDESPHGLDLNLLSRSGVEGRCCLPGLPWPWPCLPHVAIDAFLFLSPPQCSSSPERTEVCISEPYGQVFCLYSVARGRCQSRFDGW
jgi:hypothetical protein